MKKHHLDSLKIEFLRLIDIQKNDITYFLSYDILISFLRFHLNFRYYLLPLKLDYQNRFYLFLTLSLQHFEDNSLKIVLLHYLIECNFALVMYHFLVWQEIKNTQLICKNHLPMLYFLLFHLHIFQ